MGAVTVVEILCHLVAYQIEGDRLSAIVDLAFTYPEFAIAAKRGHDRNMPPWVPASFSAPASCWTCSRCSACRARDEPNTLALVISLPFTVFGLALLADLGFRRGTRGPNRYGPDPLGSKPCTAQ